ncbi:MAG: efflux transporter outer membrane subunit [Bacteroidales bacterium]|nr:efflux transporter outer membrane subunit [Bacteroidales bacterium]
MKNRIPYIIIVGLIFIIGCKVGPNFTKPQINNPTAFVNDSTFPTDSIVYDSAYNDSIMNLVWWEQFQDTTLQKLIKTALDNNKNYLIAISRIEEARASLGYTRSDIYPSVNIGADATRTNFNGTSQIDAYSAYSITPSISWEIDFWGKLRRANESAKASLLATEFGRQKIMTSLISDVIGSYFLLLDYNARYEISVKTHASRKEYMEIIQARFDKGIVPEIDLNHSQIQEAQAESSIYLYQRLVSKTEYALSILLGKTPGKITKGLILKEQIVPPEIPPGLPSDLLKRRPDIKEAEHYLVAQNAKIGMAQAMRFPSISLTGLLGVASGDLSTLTSQDAGVWAVSGGLLSPVFQFGKNKQRVEIEKNRTNQALLVYEQTFLVALREVEDALVDIATLKEELKARKRQVQAAEKAAELAKLRYDKGISSYLEVLESNRQLFDAELVTTQTFEMYLIAYVSLYKALGGGWLEDTYPEK